MPMSGDRQLERPVELGFVMDFGENIDAPIMRGGFKSRARPSSIIAMMSRMQSAPQARASAT